MGALARWCVRHSWIIVIAWFLAFIGVTAVAKIVGSSYSSDFALPSTESTRAVDLLKQTFPSQSGETDRIVIHTTTGTVLSPPVQALIEPMLERVRGVKHVTDVTSPYSPRGKGQVSRDGTIAFATVTFDNAGTEPDKASVSRVIDIAESARVPGVEVELGGNAIQQQQQQGPAGLSELVGVVFAAIVLFVAFGSLLAMALPLFTAIMAIGGALSSIVLLTHVFRIADFAPQLAALLGLGVGIDYALFIVTRYRQNVQAGLSTEDSVVTALNTSGRAVLFAGITVCIAVLGMFALGVSFLYGLAVTAALAVLLTMIAALTLLPALLGIFGRHALSRREQRRLEREGPHAPELSGAWGRWARGVQRHRWWALGVSLAVIVVLALPFLGIRLGVSDEGNDRASTTTRKAYDLVATGFGPGFNGPFLVAIDTTNAANGPLVATAVERRLASVPGVASVTPPFFGPNGQTAVITVFPTTAPQDERTSQLLDRLRHDVIPAATQGTGARAYVGGLTAIFNDFSHVLKTKLPQFIGVIILLSFLVLMTVFRSILIPVKAALLNMLSIAGAFGVVVAIFQWGWAGSVVGVDRTGPIEPFLPVMIFAILFGLSMDYEVFLVSRMHEEWVRTRDNSEAVTRGLAATGRVITAAGAIMIFIFASFALGGNRTIKLFGISFALAVFLDAFLIRSLLVPAFMQLVGRANWWLPDWLDRLLPDVHLEADDLHDEPVPEFTEPVEAR